MATNLSKFMDWKSSSFDLLMNGTDLIVRDKFLFHVCILGARTPETVVKDVLHAFGFKKEK